VPGIFHAISCASARFLISEGLFWHAALDGNGVNMAGSFAEDLVKSLQNSLNFGGIGGS
jgi:hypothetical protein